MENHLEWKGGEGTPEEALSGCSISEPVSEALRCMLRTGTEQRKFSELLFSQGLPNVVAGTFLRRKSIFVLLHLQNQYGAANAKFAFPVCNY